jgi:outer membrane autotransporter protein
LVHKFKYVAASIGALLLASASSSALAADQVIIVGESGWPASAATGLEARLIAAGYDVTITNDASTLTGNLGGISQVWDVRPNVALSTTDASNYLGYLNDAGGLFLLGENSGFATRNNSIVDFIANTAGGGDVTYGGGMVQSQYVTDIFNGSALITADSATSFYVPASGTFSNPGNGTYVTTAGPNGTGDGTGIAYGAGSLTNALTGRLLTYLDVNTFQAEYYEATPALQALIDRMIGFVAGSFQVDPSLPSAGTPTIIDASQPSFNLGDSAATGSTISFDGGTLDVTGGTDPDNLVTADVSISDNGAFINTAGNSSTFSGTVSGNGGMIVSGQGTIALTGTNSYAGGTVITDSSTVQISGNEALGSGGVVLMGGQLETLNDTTLSAPITLMSGVNAIDTGANTVSADGIVSGAGGFIKTGSGTLILTGANDYTGGTVIANGTLEGTTSSIVGDVVNGGNLVFNQAADGSFGGVVSGTGSFTKGGSGTLVLTGANSYTGGTVITDGTLEGSASSIVGDVVNGGSFVLNQAADGAYAGGISGTGSFTKTGEGRLNLTGTSSYSGDTIVEEGRLAVNGSIANSTVTVESGGSIGGNGTVGGLIVRTNATAAPGNSIGQLHAATTVLFEAGSIYQVEADATGASDRVAASGVATLQGGTVQVLAAAGNYRPQTSYEILTANGGVNGQFAAVTSNLAFLMPTLAYSANAVTLTLTRNDIRFADVAATANQRATAGAIDASFAPTSAVYYALVGQSAESARSAFDSLSGEVHPSALSAAARQPEEMRRALLDRLATPGNERPTLWTEVVGSWHDLDGNANTAAVKSDARGFRVGLEANAGPVRVGIAGGYTDGDMSAGARRSSADVETINGAVYAGADFGALTLRGGASYSDLDFKTHRTATAGTLSQQLNAHYNGRAIQAFGEAGYSLPLGIGSVQPFVGVNALWLKNDAFTEQGGSLALKGEGETRGRAWSTLGLKASLPLGAGSPASIRVKAGWEHALTKRTVASDLAFASGGPAFTVEGAPLAKDAALVDAGVNWKLSKGLSLGVAYTGTLADQSQSHAAKAMLAISF